MFQMFIVSGIAGRWRSLIFGYLPALSAPTPASPEPVVPIPPEIVAPPPPEPPPVKVAVPETPTPLSVFATLPEVRRPAIELAPARTIDRELGKGGKQHRYLQSLVKELAEQVGLKATIEASLTNGAGQVDVLLERDGVVAAVEISVSTTVEHERENLRKCLDAGYPRIAVVLAKSKKTISTYRKTLSECVPDINQERVVFLTPEESPDFVSSLAPAPEQLSDARIVRGYR
jgi:hypothetical protein